MSSYVFLIALIGLVVLRLGAGASGIHYVAVGGDCGLFVSPCHGQIQDAEIAASAGDEMRVAGGNYTDILTFDGGINNQIALITKTLSIRGGFSTADWNNPRPDINPTILDPQRGGRGITALVVDFNTLHAIFPNFLSAKASA